MSYMSPLGPISLAVGNGRILALEWRETAPASEEAPLIAEGLAQIRAYFERRLTRFDLPLAEGAGLQGRVRQAMAAIPFGETLTYGQIARAVGAPAQAVGQACGANPLPILIPCHRVLGSSGLGGFSAPGGVESKVWLLRHEGAASLLI